MTRSIHDRLTLRPLIDTCGTRVSTPALCEVFGVTEFESPSKNLSCLSFVIFHDHSIQVSIHSAFDLRFSQRRERRFLFSDVTP